MTAISAAFTLLLSQVIRAESLAPGESVEIDAHGTCRVVKNGGSNGIYVPTFSAEEWISGSSAFLNQLTGMDLVSVSDCFTDPNAVNLEMLVKENCWWGAGAEPPGGCRRTGGAWAGELIPNVSGMAADWFNANKCYYNGASFSSGGYWLSVKVGPPQGVNPIDWDLSERFLNKQPIPEITIPPHLNECIFTIMLHYSDSGYGNGNSFWLSQTYRRLTP